MTLEPAVSASTDGVEYRRLWIGNLDPRVTEFALLKLLKQYGTISKFDFLFHRSGPMKGQPRGYAFVTYKTLDSAKESLAKLQGKRIGQKTLSVKWAYAATKEEYYGKKKPLMNIPALSGAKQDKKLSKMRAIQAIEAKLKTMECLLPAQSSSSSSSSRHNIDHTMNTSRKEIRNSNSVHPIHHKGTTSNS